MTRSIEVSGTQDMSPTSDEGYSIYLTLSNCQKLQFLLLYFDVLFSYTLTLEHYDYLKDL